MAGSDTSSRNGLIKCRECCSIRGAMNYDIYAAYCEGNRAEVQSILKALKHYQLSMCETMQNILTNDPKAWPKARIALIFLTKMFVKSPSCLYECNHVAKHFMKTKGRHRVVLVMLEPCGIPRNLQKFNRILAWQQKGDPEKLQNQVLKAIHAPQRSFRQGCLYWTSCNKSVRANTRRCNISNSDLSAWKLLSNVNKIKYLFRNCHIRCTNDGCSFSCDGVNALDQFLPHLTVCRYQQVHCRYCRQLIHRANLRSHEGEYCQSRPIVCPNENCGKKVPAHLLSRHVSSCFYLEETCPNEQYGCNHVFAVKDKNKHLAICDYERQQCKVCRKDLFRIEIDNHACGVFATSSEACDNKCRNYPCVFEGTQHEMKTHLNRCGFKIEQCSSCGARLFLHQMVWHKAQCDKLVECQLCHQIIHSSSKVTHDRWSCRARNITSLCEKCGCIMNYNTLASHLLTCTGPYSTLISNHTVDEHRDSESDSSEVIPESDTNIINHESMENILLDALEAPTLVSRDLPMHVQPTSSPPYTSTCTWNKVRRQKWRNLMDHIDVLIANQHHKSKT